MFQHKIALHTILKISKYFSKMMEIFGFYKITFKCGIIFHGFTFDSLGCIKLASLAIICQVHLKQICLLELRIFSIFSFVFC